MCQSQFSFCSFALLWLQLITVPVLYWNFAHKTVEGDCHGGHSCHVPKWTCRSDYHVECEILVFLSLSLAVAAAAVWVAMEH